MQQFFTPATFDYLRGLAANNRKEWFDANRPRYEAEVRQPALRFVEAAGPGLAKISKQLVADPRPQGGSLMRVFRDVRFSKDKTPYKTNVGIGFGHRRGKEGAAPGYYLHVAPGESFSGGGMHMADSATLTQVRDAMVADTAGWKRASKGVEFHGERLKTAPKGYPADHPLIEDLKLKSWFSGDKYDEAQVCAPDFLERFLDSCRAEAPLLAFLARAVGADW